MISFILNILENYSWKVIVRSQWIGGGYGLQIGTLEHFRMIKLFCTVFAKMVTQLYTLIKSYHFFLMFLIKFLRSKSHFKEGMWKRSK